MGKRSLIERVVDALNTFNNGHKVSIESVTVSLIMPAGKKND
jgi:hypothetical protein